MVGKQQHGLAISTMNNQFPMWRSYIWPMLTGALVSAIVYSVALAVVVRGEERAVREMQQLRVTNEARLSEVIRLQNEQTQVLGIMIQCLLRSNLDSTARREFNLCLVRAEELTTRQRALIHRLMEDRPPSRNREPWVARDLARQYLKERTLCIGLKQLAIPLEIHTAQLLNLLQTSKNPVRHT